MNILPHKSWHVRTKANIARVRKDEAKAAEEEKERQRRIDLAEQEARIEILRKKARSNRESPQHHIDGQSSTSSVKLTDSQHVNLFQALEEGRDTVKKPNAEHEKEKKEEQEKYEKQIGYLTYLGQDTNESLKKQDWYEELPDRDKSKTDRTEVGLKFKSYHDPLNVIRKFLPNEKLEPACGSRSLATKYEPLMSQVMSINKELETRKESKRSKKKSKKKSKKHKNKHKKKKSSSKKRKHESSTESSSSSTESDEDDAETQALKRQKLEILRQERLKREQVERARAEQLLAKVRGDPPPKPKIPNEPERPQIKQKYNSQFNPELARQNYDDR
ncbi:leukocyte receptor cluster member 1 homolog [Culicoides brevitarsis]|uniref:leukocyte receptor cluster member 1 homolog n=1 Tax=Culicoides brevitarsis TaxID=469753 RepID=UPI00307C720B